ncbi:MAG TPA: hypothetical protein VFL41_03485 [Gaiellaceae bacterium]|nr:hypothetical protein [Gaiellaceae bacterium]HET8652319.1 hypothetical protein [Gaiellaceae bacterium]
MEQISARAALVSAPDVQDGLSTTVARSEVQDALAADEAPIELVLDVTRFSDGEAAESRNVAVAWERSDLEQLLRDAQGEDIVLTFDRDALRRAMEGDVEAHGIRETALVLAVAATAAAGVAGTAAGAPDPGTRLGGATASVQSVSPDDRAFARTPPAAAPDTGVSPDDRGFARVSPGAEPTTGISPDDRALPRSPVPEPGVSPDDRALPRSPVPEPGVSPDDRALPRTSPLSAPEPGISPDDRALPRTPIAAPDTGISPDDRTFPRVAPSGGTVSDPGTSWAPSPETVAVAGAVALLITGAFFVIGTGRRRVRPI